MKLLTYRSMHRTIVGVLKFLRGDLDSLPDDSQSDGRTNIAGKPLIHEASEIRSLWGFLRFRDEGQSLLSGGKSQRNAFRHRFHGLVVQH